jgi:phosphoglycolate phosphatase
MPRLAAILFDKDGTLIDFDATFGPAGYALLRRLSAGNDAHFNGLAQALGYDTGTRRFRKSSPFVAGSTEVYGPLIAAVLGRGGDRGLFRELDEILAEEAANWVVPIGDPAAVLVQLAARGLLLGIATNDSEGAARRQAAALGLAGHMAFIAGYDSGYGGKPGPGMVQAFARQLGLPCQAIALVGDSPEDMHAARNAGSRAIAVLSGPASAADLAPCADHLLAQLADLPLFLDSLAGADGP